MKNSDYLPEPVETWEEIFDLNDSWENNVDLTTRWSATKLEILWQAYDDEFANLQDKLNAKTAEQADFDNYYSALEDAFEHMQYLENEIGRVASEKAVENLGDMAYEDAVERAKLGETVIEGGYLKTGFVDASRIDTGTLNAEAVTVSSQDGTTFNLSGNDLVIDTNQFTLDEEGNGTFSGKLEAVSGSFDDGDVYIDGDGITIEDGGLTVKNSQGDVIIDGSSDMFRIHQTGTVTASGDGFTSVSFPDLGYRPAFLIYFLDDNERANLPWYDTYDYGDGPEAWGMRASVESDRLRIENRFSSSYDVRYYILKQEAI